MQSAPRNGKPWAFLGVCDSKVPTSVQATGEKNRFGSGVDLRVKIRGSKKCGFASGLLFGPRGPTGGGELPSVRDPCPLSSSNPPLEGLEAHG